MPIILKTRQIVKKFGKLVANDHIDFEIKEGEIHALLGENGAGKTTLMNILYGLLSPDEGEIYIRGQKVKFKSPKDAIKQKIGMVSQNFSLIPALTVSENIALGNIPTKKFFLLDRDLLQKRVLSLAESYDFDVDPGKKIEELSAGEQQWVEILKAFYHNIKILILDEPTAMLISREVKELFKVLRSMISQKGRSVIFITHKLSEAMNCDRVTVLRRGKVILKENTNNITKEELTKAMFGERLSFPISSSLIIRKNINIKESHPLLEVKNLCVINRGLNVLKDISFNIFPGEIFGVAGVAGNGQKELIEVITGIRKAVKGKILLKGENITNYSPKLCREKGMRYIPEDRLKEGSFDNLSLAENLILGREDKPPFAQGFLLDYSSIRSFSKKMILNYDVKASSIKMIAKNLSGGNLQKLILAREISSDLDFLAAFQPTRGLDVRASRFIHQKLLEQKRKEKGVLLVSYDLDEILELSDRIGVMYKGRMVVVPPEKINVNEIEKIMVEGMKEECE
jgi:simple sugar transport system ATP-binding protein